jgi:alanyl-tRNA synthetase
MLKQQHVLESVARELKTTWTDLPDHIAALQERHRVADRELSRTRGQLAGARVGDLLDRATAVDGTKVLSARVEVESKDGLRQMGDRLRDRLESGVIVLGTVIDGRPSLLSIVTSDLVARGVRAGDIVKEAATLIDGRGGGRADLAEAGGKDAAKLDDALASVTDIVRRGLAV